MVELAEDQDHEDVAVGHGVLRMGLEDGLEAGEGAFVVEDVEALEGVADGGIEVERIGVADGGIDRLGTARDRGKSEENQDKEKVNVSRCGGANVHAYPSLTVVAGFSLPREMLQP